MTNEGATSAECDPITPFLKPTLTSVLIDGIIVDVDPGLTEERLDLLRFGGHIKGSVIPFPVDGMPMQDT